MRLPMTSGAKLFTLNSHQGSSADSARNSSISAIRRAGCMASRRMARVDHSMPADSAKSVFAKQFAISTTITCRCRSGRRSRPARPPHPPGPSAGRAPARHGAGPRRAVPPRRWASRGRSVSGAIARSSCWRWRACVRAGVSLSPMRARTIAVSRRASTSMPAPVRTEMPMAPVGQRMQHARRQQVHLVGEHQGAVGLGRQSRPARWPAAP